jgi:hypothetical protein
MEGEEPNREPRSCTPEQMGVCSMLEFLKSLSSSWFGADDRRRQETEAEDAARLIEMDEPMAGAGGQVSGMHSKSETEKALERAPRTSE